jgi:hypothetical protein
LKILANGAETIVTISYKYLGDMNKAWVLDHYNGFDGRALRRGDVILVPLLDLELTEKGRAAVEHETAQLQTQAQGPERKAQRQVEAELPALIADIRGGRYVSAITRGTRFLSFAELSDEQLAAVHRQLLEAHAALDAHGQATQACIEWLKYDKRARIDPVMMSPKLVAACERGAQ